MKTQMLAVLAASLLGPVTAHADYTFAQIDYPDVPNTLVFGINNRGEVVGHGSSDVQVPFVYRWRRVDFTDVPPVSSTASGDMVTFLSGINDSHVIVGSVTSQDGSVRLGFVRSTDGTYSTFSHPDADGQTQARAVNDNGLVSGFRDAADGSTVGFIYDTATATFVDIVPSLSTIAHGINSAGEVVGSANFDADVVCPGAPAGKYGWLRFVDGSVTFFQVNGQPTQARGINDAHGIAGSISDADTATERGFVVELTGSEPCVSLTIPARRFLEFPGYDSTLPEGISNSGAVVGMVFNNDDGVTHGFIATRN